jgi:hypothetical protein
MAAGALPLSILLVIVSRFHSLASAPPGDSHPQQERDQQRPERRFPRDVAQDAERHAGLFAFLDRVAYAIGGAPDASETSAIVTLILDWDPGLHTQAVGRACRRPWAIFLINKW